MTRAGAIPDKRAHAVLRRATRDLHDILDGVLTAWDLTTRAGYVRYLKANLPCAVVEPALTAAGLSRLLPDWPGRQRRHALAGDLDRLGEGGKATGATPVILSGDATLLGWAYVLEGSRLGAAVILRRVNASTDPAPGQATAFLRHGEGVPYWPRFLSVLSRLDGDSAALDRAAAAARLAFGCFLAGVEDAAPASAASPNAAPPNAARPNVAGPNGQRET